MQQPKKTLLASSLSWWLLLVASDAQQPPLQQRPCRTPEQQQGEECQSICKCDCDEYFASDPTCRKVCEEIDNQPVVDAVPWCADYDYDYAEECDELFGGKWKNSTVEYELGIPYLRAYGRDFKLDFYTDANRTGEDLPLALIVHGGGFNSGSRTNCKIIEAAREFASRGYRTIAIDYPMCGAYWSYVDPLEQVPAFGSGGGGWHAWDAEEPLYPGPRQDPQCYTGAAGSQNPERGAHPEQYAQSAEVANRAGKHAIKYSHDRAAEWEVDVDRTLCYGSSAGAIACYEMLLWDTSVRFKSNVTGLEIDPDLDALRVHVAAGRAGGLSVQPEVRAVTRETVDAMAPTAAVYNVHGTNDTVVDIAKAEFLVAEMERFDLVAELVTVDGAGHSLFPWQFNASHPERLDDMFHFIEANLPTTSSEPPVTQESTLPMGDDDYFSGGRRAVVVGASLLSLPLLLSMISFT